MAWLELDPTSGYYHVAFRLGERKFKRSLKTTEEAKAKGLAQRLEENIADLERGRLVMPEGADVVTFLLSDGKLLAKPSPAKELTLTQLFDDYFAALPEGNVEQCTIDGMKIHQRHLARILGGCFAVRSLTQADLQSYVEKRSKEKGLRGKKVTATTIKKAIVTFRTIWHWGEQNGKVHGKFPQTGLKYPKSKEKPPFQTWEEIERQVVGLPKGEAAELWDCLFLTLPEIEQFLAHAKEKARQPFVYPMLVFAAHTGARRAEIVRSQIRDIDLAAGMVTIHERKKSHDSTTIRRVPMSPLLSSVMKEWLARHPGGSQTFCHGLQVARSKTKRNQPMALTRDEAHDHFKRTTAGSKWEKLRGWHVLRHSFASNCAAKGIDQRIINGWMGHQTEEMVRRYRHLFPNQQRQAIELVFGNGEQPVILQAG